MKTGRFKVFATLIRRCNRATKVELYINLKTAKTLGIAIPLPLSGRADELIE